METEIWKPVPGSPGYEVSDLGNVQSYHKGHATHALAQEPYLLKPSEVASGGHIPYHRVHLCCGKERHKYLVHQLVLEAFVGPCPEGMEACHNNGNFRDNRLDNLRWDTKKANMADQLRHGTRIMGEHHPHAKLTVAKVVDIRKRYAAGEFCIPLAAEFGITPSAIAHICTGRSWKSAPGPIHIGGTMFKERTPHGERSYFHQHPELNRGKRNWAKLNEQQVIDIRIRYAQGERSKDIGLTYGIDRHTVVDIAAGNTWADVDGPVTKHRR